MAARQAVARIEVFTSGARAIICAIACAVACAVVCVVVAPLCIIGAHNVAWCASVTFASQIIARQAVLAARQAVARI